MPRPVEGAADRPLELVPARMINEHAYCPRLAYLEWVEGEFQHSADTLEGRCHHRRVDREQGNLPPADEVPVELRSARSVLMSAPKLGVIARLDLVELQRGQAVPVEVKRGKAPDVPGGAWEPERLQSAAQVLVLRENGHDCPHGVLYFAGSRRRVIIEVDEATERRVREVVAELRASAAAGRTPPPLVDSPKCPRCSLVGICLPDEVATLTRALKREHVRRLFPTGDDRVPLIVQAPGARIGKRGERLVVAAPDGARAEARLMELSHVAVHGNVSLSAQATAELLDRGIPICHYSHGGWFRGMTGALTKNVDVRRAQYRAADHPEASLAVSRAIVAGKVLNQRTMLRRNARGDVKDTLVEMKRSASAALRARGLETLLGVEGAAARAYFSRFASLLRPPSGVARFDFTSRNRRPPADPVNALLSFGYALLIKELTITCQVVGFDPYLGLYHQPKHGKPALALDLAEEFRPIVTDSIVIGAVNNGEVRPEHFVTRGGACALTKPGRTALVAAHERRLGTLVRHPTFGYSVSYRRVLEIQTRLLARHLVGEIEEYVPFRTR